MTKLYSKQTRFPEDPNFHWELVGEAMGNTTKEVADNYAKKDKDFARYYNAEKLTFWGWELKIERL